MNNLKIFALSVLGSVALNAMASEEVMQVRVPGKVDGFGALPVDDVVDGALVLKSFKPSDITQFRIEHFIAPNEEMKAGPQKVQVPGNFYVPRQAEKMKLIRINLEKSEFGYYTNRGEQDEVIATSFKAPFSKIIELGKKGDTTASQLLPLISLERFDFKSIADHSRKNRLDFNLKGNFVDSMSYNWSRAKGTADESDHVFVFQQTPAERWILADIVGNASTTGRLKKAQGFANNFKVVFARLKEAGGGLKEIRATISSDGRAQGVPATIANARIQGTTVLWDAPEGNGWMSVVTEIRKASILKTTPFWFMDLSALFDIGAKVSHDWVDPRDGSFVMMPPDGSDPKNLAVTLAFVQTEQPVKHPDSDPTDELFHNMKSISVKVLR